MEIKIETGTKDLGRLTANIHLMEVDIKSLPSLTGDEIREMVRPIIESRLWLDNPNVDREHARKFSYLHVYGKERCHESFPELFDTERDSESSCSSNQ